MYCIGDRPFLAHQLVISLLLAIEEPHTPFLLVIDTTGVRARIYPAISSIVINALQSYISVLHIEMNKSLFVSESEK